MAIHVYQLMSDAYTGIKAKHAARATNLLHLKPFDLSGVFSGPSVPLPYKYRLFSSHPHPDSTTLLPSQYTIPLQRALHLHSPTPLTHHSAIHNMPAVVSNATRIWELNIYWSLHSQCGVWDPKGRGVDIWECIRARTF